MLTQRGRLEIFAPLALGRSVAVVRRSRLAVWPGLDTDSITEPATRFTHHAVIGLRAFFKTATDFAWSLASRSG